MREAFAKEQTPKSTTHAKRSLSVDNADVHSRRALSSSTSSVGQRPFPGHQQSMFLLSGPSDLMLLDAHSTCEGRKRGINALPAPKKHA
jgi:hypothetical protein